MLVVRRAADEADRAVAELEQVLSDQPHALGVARLDPRERARRHRMPRHDHRQPGVAEHVEPAVVDLDVAQQEAVDAPRGGEPS